MARRYLPLRCLFCLLALSLALPHSARAQQGPARGQVLSQPGGSVTHLAAAPDGGAVYAVAVAGVNRNADQTQTLAGGQPARADALYKSVDRGASWKPVTNDLPPGSIPVLFVDRSGSIWVSAQPRGDGDAPAGALWSSSDGGSTWRSAPLGRDDLHPVDMTQETSGQILLLAFSGLDPAENLLYRRGSDGVWSSAAVELPDGVSAAAASLIAHPSEPRLFLTTESGHLFMSTGGGAPWISKGSPALSQAPGAAQFAILPDRPEVALLVRSGQPGLSVERSSDSGDTWSRVSVRGLPSGPVAPTSLVAAGKDVLVLTTDRGVYRSADRGETWQALEGALDSSFVYDVLPIPSLATVGSNSLLAGTAYGLFASQDRGALWRAAGDGLPPNSAVVGLMTHPNQPDQMVALVRTVGAAGASLMLLSRDGGATWLPAGPAGGWADATAWAIDPQDPSRLYLAGENYVAMSEDAGVSWKRRETASAVRTAIAVSPSNPQRVYVDGAPRLVSDDGGETWTDLPPQVSGDDTELARGVAIDPKDPDHVWFGFPDGVRESRDGGQTLQRAGLDGSTARWLTLVPEGEGSNYTLFAGIQDGGVMRWSSDLQDWQPAQAGLPASSNVLAFAADPAVPGLLWATRDGGGVYASADNGANWKNAALGAGDNLGLALAPNYRPDGGWFMGTALAGVWLLGSDRPAAEATQTPPGPTAAPGDVQRSGVDARIEVVWPHDFASLQEATLANVGIRLFLPRGLESPSCGWRPRVELWRAVDTEPASPAKDAEQRTVDDQSFPYWDANDIDVASARAEDSRIYFLVKVGGVDTATSVWAHGADARTYFPEQLVPSGIATGVVNEVDARIQIVWPHDESGAARGVQDATLANVAVTLFKHGTRLSVSPNWRPPSGDVRLYGAWNSEVSRAFNVPAAVSTRQSGVITYPVWEFNDVPVDRARDGLSKLYLWTEVDGVRSYPTIWAHGADTRAFFPAQDEPIQGCLP